MHHVTSSARLEGVKPEGRKQKCRVSFAWWLSTPPENCNSWNGGYFKADIVTLEKNKHTKICVLCLKNSCCLWNKDTAGPGRISQIVSQSGRLFLASTISICSNEGRFIYFVCPCVTSSLLGKGDIVTLLSFHCLHFTSYPPILLSFPPFFLSPWLHCHFLFYPMSRDHITWNSHFLFIISFISHTGIIMTEHKKKRQRVGCKPNSRSLSDISRP